MCIGSIGANMQQNLKISETHMAKDRIKEWFKSVQKFKVIEMPMIWSQVPTFHLSCQCLDKGH